MQQLTDPESGITSLQWDAQSQLVALQQGDCHHRFTYDSAGRFTGCSGGHRPDLPDRHWHYDEKGLLKRAEIAGAIFFVTYDDQGRACAIGESAGAAPLLQWQNDGHNLVRHLRFAGGSSWYLNYDLRGRLSALETDGGRFLWRYDRCGRLREFSDNACRQREWQYDANGRVSEYRDSDNHWYLEYRADGALEKIRNNSGQYCRFHFDDAGRLSQASNNGCHLRFQYDRCNRLAAEHHDVNIDNRRESLSIHYEYDARGWLRGAGSDEVSINYIFAAGGALYGVDVNGEMLLRTEREHISTENADDPTGERNTESIGSEKWSLGEHKLVRHFVRGLLQQVALGDHCRWKTDAASTIGTQPALIFTRSDSEAPSTETACDRRGNLVSEVRASANGPRHYSYQFDGWGLMHSAECGDFSTYFRYDPFGRRLAKISSHRRSRRQRRVSSYWTSLGLWREVSRVGESRTATHFLYHPLDNTPLARLTRTDDSGGEEGRSIREERHFYVADDRGCLLALLDNCPVGLPPRWNRNQKPSQGNTGPGAFRGGDGTLDGETQLYYRDFSYWHTDHRTTSAPLDAGQCRLLASHHPHPGTVDPGWDAPSNRAQSAAAVDDESITNPSPHVTN
ncbi:hypothetical protein [Microbulbifer pacificus]|uniref:hypothetical protein n=1 Tax=Microbulbifer pacificus TaxID=407164 RepID=UPI001319F793|nr:hypothetical protein [Microbulbifer pacificus]